MVAQRGLQFRVNSLFYFLLEYVVNLLRGVQKENLTLSRKPTKTPQHTSYFSCNKTEIQTPFSTTAYASFRVVEVLEPLMVCVWGWEGSGWGVGIPWTCH